jgi:predicted acyl esterase
MKALLTALALASVVTAAAAQAQNPSSTYAVSTQAKIEYAQHDGVTLTGDLYLPKGVDKAPLVIAADGRPAAPSPTGIGDLFSPSTATRYLRSATGCRSPAPRRFLARSMMSKPPSSSCAPTPRGSASIRTASG